MQYHFISGLPRSGSSLLSGILCQNPRFFASMSGPVGSLIHGTLQQIGAGTEFNSFFSEEKRKIMCHSIFDAYYYDQVDKEVIFDTNRMWTARLHQLTELFEDFKVICCVRNPAWVLDSFERIYRKNPFNYSKLFSPQSRQTVYTRCESMVNGGVVGLPWTALKEAFYGEFSEKLLLIDYDLLAQHPKNTIRLLYKFIEEPWFDHDFDNVIFSQNEFDDSIGVKGLHTVQRKVEFNVRRSILPPDLFHKYSEMAFWKDPAGTMAGIIGPRQELKKAQTIPS